MTGWARAVAEASRLTGTLQQVPDEEATAKAQEEADKKAAEEGKEAAEAVEPITKSQSREDWDWRVQNDNKPLWTRNPREVRRVASLASRSCGVCHRPVHTEAAGGR